ncbi:MAG TPA: carboxypeptidase regulatory-like domain-containing protein [Pyrinomonadaceae bacterium]|nr:carboxypeptidase regulatory-like domain-containing protein [Pyrinomonadaceae bacterium]
MPFKIIVFTAVVLATAISSTAAGQTSGSVKGKVLKTDGSPILNAVVRVKDSDKSTRTDKDGTYSLASLDGDKNYTLEISKNPLYEPKTKTVAIKANITVDVEDVRLLRLPPDINGTQKILDRLRRGDIAQVEADIELIELACRGETDEYCKNMTAVRKQLDKNNITAARNILVDLAAIKERNPENRQR